MTAPAPLGWRDLALGSDPDLLRAELLHIIRARISNHPRSKQQTIGPSELGGSCLRRLGFRLSGVVGRGAGSAAWRPTVGTAVHTWLAETFEVAGCVPATADTGGWVERWATERRVMVGTVAGAEVWGSCDLYDRVTATVVDWKIVGATTLKSVRSKGPSGLYRTQVNLYGRGFRNAGLPVERVAAMFLPSSGELHEAVYWSEEYSEDVATQALSRAEGLALALKAAGPEIVIPALSTSEQFCTGCPWFTVRARVDSSTECPGHDAVARAIEGKGS